MSRAIRRVPSICLAVFLLGSITAFAQNPTIVHAFDGVTTGNPSAGLTMGSDGLLYGTAEAPGTGRIFRVRPDGTGYEMLYAFGPGEGAVPSHAPLARGSDNVFFGTTLQGGAAGRGTVYRLHVQGTLATLTTLYDFGANGSSEGYPDGGVIIGSDGMLYGTFGDGTSSTDGIYRLATDGTGFALLRYLTTGIRPTGTLIESIDGFLYGTTERGGATDGGTVFRISRDGVDYTVLAELEGHPVVGVTEAAGPDGTLQLFGAEADGMTAATQYGAIFRLRKDGTGFQRIGLFTGGDRDGLAPRSPLLLGSDLNLYGATAGSIACPIEHCGSIVRVSPTGSAFAVVALRPPTGAVAMGALVQGPNGTLYGTARIGGPGATDTVPGHGVVFAVLDAATAPVELTGPAVADEGSEATYTIVIRNRTNTLLTAPVEVTVTPSAGLTFTGDSPTGWTCTPTSDGRVRCRWPFDIPDATDTPVHTLIFTAAAPFPAPCGYGPSPCVHVAATIDGTAGRSVQTIVRALVNGMLNSPPTPADDTLPLYGTGPAVLRVLANDSDPDGDALRIARIVEPPQFGTATIDPGGTITYVPSATLVGSDTFLYEVDDQHLPTPARAMARATVVPSIPGLRLSKTRLDLGGVAVGRWAAGRFYLDSDIAADGHIDILPVSAAEIATALQGTSHDSALAASDPSAFRLRYPGLRVDPDPAIVAGLIVVHYRAPATVGRVSVAKVVMTVEPEGLPPMIREVLIVGASADPAAAPVRATHDHSATPPTTPLWYDVLANDAGVSGSGRPLYVAEIGCVYLQDDVFNGDTCYRPDLLGADVSLPSSLTGPQEVTIRPVEPGTGTTVVSYASAELDECVTSPQSSGVCRLEGNMYYAHVFVDVGGTTPDLSLAFAPVATTVVPGQPFSLTATVTNHGPGMASRVTVSGFSAIALARDLAVTSSQGTCAFSVLTGLVTCSLWNLLPDASATITVLGVADQTLIPDGQTGATVTVAATASFGTVDSQPGDNTAQALMTVGFLTADVELTNGRLLAATSATPVTRAVVGDVLNYRVMVANGGAPTSGPVSVRTSMAGMVPLQLPAACASPMPSVVECTIPAMAAGASVELGFWLTVGPIGSGTLSSPVPVTTTATTAGELQTSNNTSQIVLLVENRANLRVRSASFIDRSHRPITFARVGDTVLFSVVIENVGQVASQFGVQVGMDMPGGLVSRGGFCPPGTTPSSPTVEVCRLPVVQPGDTARLEGSFEVQPFAVPVGQATTLLTATARILDLSANSGAAALTVADRLRPDLQVARASFTDLAGTPVTSAYVGDIVVFEALIENVGNQRSTPGDVDIAMLFGATAVRRSGMTACPGSLPFGNAHQNCILPSIDVGSSHLIRVAYRVTIGDRVLTATAVARQRDLGRFGSPETVLANNTGSARLTTISR